MRRLTGDENLTFEFADPESLRTLMNRYYEGARVVLERHGGTVEKFVGDAVMAVFGSPVRNDSLAARRLRSQRPAPDGPYEAMSSARS